MEKTIDTSITEKEESKRKEPRKTWTWNFAKITETAFDESVDYIANDDNTEEAREMLDKTKGYFRNHKDKQEIWKNANIDIFDPHGNELLLKSGEGQYKIFVNQVRGKTQILCRKDNETIVKREEL